MTVAELFVGHLKAATQRGIHSAPPFVFEHAGRVASMTAEDVSMSVSRVSDETLRRRLQMILALGDYKLLPASERRLKFARDCGKSFVWANVSRSYYPITLRAFASQVFADSTTDWDDCELSWRVVGVFEDVDVYRLRSVYEMTVTTNKVRFAQSFDEELAESLCAEFPDLLEVFTPVQGGHCEFRVSVRLADRVEPWRRLQFHRDRARVQAFADLSHRAASSNTVFWETEDLPELTRWRIRLECDWDLRMSWQYFQWSAPHRVRLQAFEADLSLLKPHLKGGKLALLNTTRDRTEAFVDQEAFLCRLDFGQVIEPGQVIRVDWTPE